MELYSFSTISNLNSLNWFSPIHIICFNPTIFT